MGADEPDEAKLPLIINRQNHSIFVTTDIENNPRTFEDAGCSQLGFDLLALL